ncbi:MAG TPA: transglutaminase family protein [Polyangiaceae bacterium]|nr:transglutaminase family protein [Polyangiaceae bacterium]
MTLRRIDRTTEQVRRLRVKHATRYAYDRPVERSLHQLRLTPIEDRFQRIVTHALRVEPAVRAHQLEDPFGNSTTTFSLETPYVELVVTAESTVDLSDVDPFEFARSPAAPAEFPLAWLPAERVMLAAYLTPPELPEAQIGTLYEYALSFAQRNDRNLLETLFDLNLTLFREYRYAPGSTTLSTTAFDVLTTRQGVCQDFAGLFICLARLLGIPARYVCGYVFTGNVATDRPTSDATHAWVELYLPNVGWKGFDPTNGILPATDHVRVARGRTYQDATPTSGTLFSPASETLSTEVEVADDTRGAEAGSSE